MSKIQARTNVSVLSFASVFLIGFCSGNKILSQSQSFTFYAEPNCGGQSQIFTESNFDLSNHWVTNSSSYFLEGMWQVHFRGNTMTTRALMYGRNGHCDRVLPETMVTGLERFTALNKEAKEITLFSDQNFRGIRIEAKEAGLKFTRPISIQSFLFTGKHEWTVFRGLNYDGKSECLVPSQDVEKDGNGITYKWKDTQITFGSIQFGCNSSTSFKSTFGIIASFLLVSRGILFNKM